MTTTKATETAAGTGVKTDKEKACNPSVCVGDAQPTSCVCPITQKK